MKKFTFQVILLLIVISVAIFLYQTGPSLSLLPIVPETTASKQMQVGNAGFSVEVADTQEKRSKGLGGRPSLAPDEGMLFVFPQAGRYPFWMKGLSFPLDFIWIRGDKVVDLTENASPPAPGLPDESLPIYQSKEDIDKVLEVPAGSVKRLNIKIGDTARIL